MITMDPTTISIIALCVAAMAFVFGSGSPLKLLGPLRARLKRKHVINAEIDRYLFHSTMFLEGLPHFVRHTWEWGPSVPNYAAAGSFPPETPSVEAAMPEVCSTVRAATEYYSRHSATAGKPNLLLEDGLTALRCFDSRYWLTVEAYARRRWPLRWRIEVRRLRQLRIPQGEHDRIRQLRTDRSKQGAA